MSDTKDEALTSNNGFIFKIVLPDMPSIPVIYWAVTFDDVFLSRHGITAVEATKKFR
jgi:hypothetical protein